MSVALTWFKSSYSNDEGGNCLEVAHHWDGNCVAAHPTTIHVRDSKNPDGPTLTLSPTTWAAFTRHA
ncbi:hypothetical protein HY68_06880 [Streptomyces sp. AcH 505]|uniref:DUF397 domain-containing protein n=1 Tax=Streptomyces sp. AcH 505 TaxID=352211 RepID=UPI000591BC90|nr:hypothetical protein HY68_06880 [Streptomyces sp. AcH 505]